MKSLVVSILLLSISSQAFQVLSQETPKETRSQNVTKISARISLKRNNLDIDDSVNNLSDEQLESIDSIADQLSLNISTVGKNTTKSFGSQKISKSQRSNRRLSNFLSVLLPGSSNADSDYDDSSDDAEVNSAEAAASGSTSGSNVTTDKPSTWTNKENTTSSSDQVNDRLVAKYSRPTRYEGVSGEANDESSSQQTNHPDLNSTRSLNSISSESQPVKLITGNSMQSSEPNMNDILSNLMGSMSSGQSQKDVEIKLNNARNATIEREEVVMKEMKAQAVTTTATPQVATGDNSAFERWLSKIQFRDPSMAGKKSQTRDTLHLKQSNQTSVRNSSQVPTIPTRWLQIVKANDSTINSPRTPTRQQQTRQVQFLQNSHSIKGYEPQMDKNLRYKQHPFQQQTRQQQTQLIHGIKYPSAQASTISVSTQDGASNTSLSFAMMNSMANEMSQVVNSSGPSLISERETSSPEVGNISDQNAYQSQDEILRQVTSAINFEQQLSQQQSNNIEQKNEDPNIVQNSSGEDQSSDIADSLSKLFKVGTNVNELEDIDETNKSKLYPSNSNLSPMELLKASAGAGRNDSHSVASPENINKNLDLLAEKLQQIARDQQQANGGQPSWLRHQVNPNLASLLTSSKTQLTDNPNLNNTNTNLSRIKELISKHEKSKNELKSSQESMAQLLRQLMNTEEGGKLLTAASKNPDIQSALKSQVSSKLTISSPDKSNEFITEKPIAEQAAWFPLERPGVSTQITRGLPPTSPANLIKTRTNQHPITTPNSQVGGQFMLDTPIVNQDNTKKDLNMNNLALMFATPQANTEDSDLRQNDHIIGLPIAILKENEIEMSRAQLEAAAEQLAGHKRHLLRQNQLAAINRNEAEPIEHLSDDAKLAALLLRNQPKASYTHGVTPRTPFDANQTSQMNQSKAQNLIENLQRHNLQNVLNSLSPEQMSSLIPEANQADKQSSLMSQQLPVDQILKPDVNLIANVSPESNFHTLNNPQRHQSIGEQQHLSRNRFEHLSHLSPKERPNNNQHNPNDAINEGQTGLMRQEQRIQYPQTQGSPRPTGGAPVAQAQLSNQMASIPVRPYAHNQMNLNRQMAYYHPTDHLNPMMATTGRGPPVKVREMTLHRPFGFQTHHSVAYQPNPIISSMLPIHNHHFEPRPSLIRQMSPFRAAFNQGQQLLSPLMNPQLAENIRHHFPLPAHRFSLRPPPVMSPQVYRHDHLKRLSPDDNVNISGKLSTSRAITGPRVRNLEPLGPSISHGISEDKRNVDSQQIEEIMFIPLEGFEAELDEPFKSDEESRIVQRHIALKKSTKSPRTEPEQQPRDSRFSTRFEPSSGKFQRSSCLSPTTDPPTTTSRPISSTSTDTTLFSTSSSTSGTSVMNSSSTIGPKVEVNANNTTAPSV